MAQGCAGEKCVMDWLLLHVLTHELPLIASTSTSMSVSFLPWLHSGGRLSVVGMSVILIANVLTALYCVNVASGRLARLMSILYLGGSTIYLAMSVPIMLLLTFSN